MCFFMHYIKGPTGETSLRQTFKAPTHAFKQPLDQILYAEYRVTNTGMHKQN